MMPVKNVELTKVHYFEPTKHHRNVTVPTISQEIFENTFNKNIIIRKNIFGHKWVLKINELENETLKNRKSVKFWVYSAVFLCLLIAVLGGLFFTFDLEKRFISSCIIHEKNHNISIIFNNTDVNKLLESRVVENRFLKTEKLENSSRQLENHDSIQSSDRPTNTSNAMNRTTKFYCQNCTSNHVCLKTAETEIPKCLEILDKHDPTGCGGICLLNVEFCATLDKRHGVFQCSPLNNLLHCPTDSFNCGEQCISRNKVCDGIVHCKNMQDEINCDCDLAKHFLCTNSTVCLPKSKKCDGVVDCWDRSDENQCHQGCPIQDYSCLNGQCIRKEQFCDGYIHCLDSSDEPQGCQL